MCIRDSHQSLHDVGVHTRERFRKLLGVEFFPGAQEIRVIRELLLFLLRPVELHGS